MRCVVIDSCNHTIEFVCSSRPPLYTPHVDGLTIRMAARSDKSEWAEFVQNILHSWDLDDEHKHEWFDGGRVLLCLDGDKIVGASGWAVSGCGPHIGYTGVSDAYRKRGIAQALVSISMNDVFDAGFDRIYVVTTLQEPRFAAMKLYMKLGFVVHKIQPPYTWAEVKEALEIYD